MIKVRILHARTLFRLIFHDNVHKSCGMLCLQRRVTAIFHERLDGLLCAASAPDLIRYLSRIRPLRHQRTRDGWEDPL